MMADFDGCRRMALVRQTFRKTQYKQGRGGGSQVPTDPDFLHVKKNPDFMAPYFERLSFPKFLT